MEQPMNAAGINNRECKNYVDDIQKLQVFAAT